MSPQLCPEYALIDKPYPFFAFEMQMLTMKIRCITAILFAVWLWTPGKVFGQYEGPKSVDKFYTVKEIRIGAAQLDRGDALVRVRGFIISQINEETYQFKDATGVIMVEIDPRDLPKRTFNDKTELILVGEVDYDLLDGTEINVEHIYFVE